jgi:hypothetical protein
MIGYILTNEEYTQVQGQYYTPYQFFNCVFDIDGTWFLLLSNQDKPEVAASVYAWILNLSQGEYTPKPSPPFPS